MRGGISDRMRALITGGAGFIGSHLADRLLAAGYEVRALDNLVPQVHGGRRPEYLSRDVELVVADVRDRHAVTAALEGVDALVHFAAAVGVGQSMYQIEHYTSVNVMGTATLLQALVDRSVRPSRMLVASSMSIYGEGRYRCESCGPQDPMPRPLEQVKGGGWAMRCPRCVREMAPLPTPETKTLHPRSIYAVNKRDQEEMFLNAGRALAIPTLALRFFNVYGPRQALSNPYTGVAAIFASALMNKQRPLVFEDGQQTRDFIHVRDVAEACLHAVTAEAADVALNIGTGVATSLLDLLALLGREIPGAEGVQPLVLGRFREGDVRACFADVTAARERLGFSARIPLAEGVRDLVEWAKGQPSIDSSASALRELEGRGLVT